MSPRSVLVRIIASCALALALCTAVAARGYREGELLIQYKPGARGLAAAAIRQEGAAVQRSIDQIRVEQVRLPRGVSVEAAAARFRGNPGVEYAGPNHVISVCLEPNDPWFYDEYFGYQQWGLYSPDYPNADIDATDAWDITTGSANLVIAVIDTGICTYHEDLWEKIVGGRNVILGAPDPDDYEDDHGHGTFVAGVAAASTDNGIGIAGVSWGAKLIGIKAIDCTGYGTEADAADGLIWAADHGADIINMSFAGEHVPVLQSAVEYAWNAGCVLVAASGNEDTDVPTYPAAYNQVVAVGASNEYGQRCTPSDWFIGGSNYGDYLDLVAPGNYIYSTSNGDGLFGYYDMAQGTSAAAPFVSGIAALVWSVHVDWTNAQVVEQIKTTARDVSPSGWDQYTGWGIANAYDAVNDTPAQSVKLGDLTQIGSGTYVVISDVVLTTRSSDFPDRLYVEQPDRTAGAVIPFTYTPGGFFEGDIVEVRGTVMFLDGERGLQDATVTATGHRNPLDPFAVVNKAAGGGRIGLKSGVAGGVGLNNLGLLVTVFGRVTAYPGWTYFYIDDGSGLFDGSGFEGLKIICGSMEKPSKGSWVRVTGISSCERPPGAGVTIPAIRVRRQSDILVLQ